MSSTPTISIIVPAYNVAGFIDDCLGHILPQLRAQHELLVVDDGSTDTTAQQVRALAARWPQCALRLLQQPNGGISAARNAGVAAASGDYLLFVDSDDRLQADALAALDGVIAAHQPDVIATDFCMWHPDSPGKDRRVAMLYAPDQLTEGQDAILGPFFADRHMYVWCKIVRRAIYLELGQPLFPPRRLFEDVAVVPRLLARCRTLYYLPTVLLAYRQHPVSITRVISPAWCRDFVAALAAVKPHFERIGVSEAVRAQFDAAACHFYIGVVKNSYQLPAASGDLVRAEVREIFLAGLFNPPERALALLAGDSLLSTDRASDQRCAAQVRKALAGSLLFHWQQGISRKIKLWQRMRRTRKLASAS